MWFDLALVALAAYLIGSVPFGLLLTRAAGLGDIRAIGSGNIGATNVLRTGNKKLAAATLLLDGLKAYLAVWLAPLLVSDAHAAAVAAVFAIIGHCFPVWLKFKGGKGVATAIGSALGLSVYLGAAAILIWLITAALFRYSSLAALVALLTLPGLAVFIGRADLLIPLAIITGLVFVRHHENIKRLLAGTEPKIGQKK